MTPTPGPPLGHGRDVSASRVRDLQTELSAMATRMGAKILAIDPRVAFQEPDLRLSDPEWRAHRRQNLMMW